MPPCSPWTPRRSDRRERSSFYSLIFPLDKNIVFKSIWAFWIRSESLSLFFPRATLRFNVRNAVDIPSGFRILAIFYSTWFSSFVKLRSSRANTKTKKKKKKEKKLRTDFIISRSVNCTELQFPNRYKHRCVRKKTLRSIIVSVIFSFSSAYSAALATTERKVIFWTRSVTTK